MIINTTIKAWWEIRRLEGLEGQLSSHQYEATQITLLVPQKG